MTTQKIRFREGGSSRSALPESSVGELRDRLAGLLPDDALQDAVDGLGPEEITGQGGLMTQLAGRVLEAALGPSYLSTWAIPRVRRRLGAPATIATATPPRRSRRSSARSRSAR